MTADNTPPVEQHLEKQSSKDGDKPPDGTPITSEADNRIQQLQEKREALATARLTQDPEKGFKIDTGDGKVIEDQRKVAENAYKKAGYGDPDVPVGKSAQTTDTEFKPQKIDEHTFALGVSRQEMPDTRTPFEKMGDFMQAAEKRATDPEGWKAWAQGEINKFAGIGAGLNEAKDETKAVVAAGWKAMNDGTVIEFLSQPNAINAPVFKTVQNAFEAMSKDPEAVNHAFEALGKVVMKASEDYSNLPDSEKGKVIGKVMFGMINPEGDIKDAEAALKIADTVATHVDKAVWDTAAQAMKVAENAAKNSPELAEKTKQLLYDYLKGKGLTGPEFEYAGVPKGYFNDLPNIEKAKADDGILKMVGKSGEYTPKGPPKFLNAQQGKILGDTEIEKLGGAAKLEKMTDDDLQKLGLERFCLPTLKLGNTESSIFASTTGINNALMDASVPEEGKIILGYVKKGYLPEGAGSHFLAEALKAHDVLPSNELVLSNIVNNETLKAFRDGVPAAETKLGKFAIKAFKELGITPKTIRYNWNPQIGKLDIIVEVK